MYMAPIARADAPASHPALRRAVGVPVLVLAAVITLPWLAANALVAGVAIAIGFGGQAADYAGKIALGR